MALAFFGVAFFLVAFFVVPEAAMLELLATGAEAPMAGAGVAAKAPMLNAEATTAAMRVFIWGISPGER